jgi:hypothetical protein
LEKKEKISEEQKALEAKVKKLRAPHQDHRLFVSEVKTHTEWLHAVQPGQIVDLRKDQPNPLFKQLKLVEEVHAWEHNDFIRG